MKLVILGSGTSVPHGRRASAAFWLDINDQRLLLDASADAAHRMAEEGLPWQDLDVIWVSHFHLDHAAGLANFLFGTKWAPQTQTRSKPLSIYGGEGLKRFIVALDQAGNYGLLEQPFEINVVEVKLDEEFEITHDVLAKTFSTPHTEESLAIRLTERNGATLVYTSDTGYSEDLARFAHKADLLLMECSFRQNKPVSTHLELADAMRIADLSHPARVVLTHLYPEWDNYDLVTEARLFWAGKTIEAVDGLSLEF